MKDLLNTFFKKKYKTAKKKQINVLQNENNIPLESKDDIMKEVENYYQKLYETEGINQNQINEYISHIKNILTPEESNSLNKPICETEIEQIIKEIANEKKALEKEFYAKFKEIIIPELSEIYNNTILSGRQPISPKNAIIKLLYKKEDQ